MSTVEQECSITLQQDFIARYAQDNNFIIIDSYVDEGKSGLAATHRQGLRSLLNDVVSGTARFRTILVYDVSRWGRFQDTDEAAHYEFLCKEAGVEVRYCAESFSAACDLQNSLAKAVKRVMAAQFSRELSDRVFECKSRMAKLGFRMGSSPGYALRRVLVSATGRRKRILRDRECKNLRTDHIVLEPGPKGEIRRVQEIYAAILSGKTRGWIARDLKRRGITCRGKPWTMARVTSVLVNPKYIGRNLWARTTCKLQSPSKRTSPDKWAVKDAAFPPVVQPETFANVQKLLHKGTYFKSNEELLRRAKQILQSKGRLSREIIKRARSTASVTAYEYRFGSMTKLYELVGFQQRKVFYERHRKMEHTIAIRQRLMRSIEELLPGHAAVIKARSPLSKPRVLRFDDRVSVSVLLCPSERDSNGKLWWRLNPVPSDQGRHALVCTLDANNQRVERLYFVSEFHNKGQTKFGLGGKFLARAKTLDHLEELYPLALSMAKTRARERR